MYVKLKAFQVDEKILRTFDQMTITEDSLSLLEEFDNRMFIRIIKLSKDRHSHIEGIFGSWHTIADNVICYNKIVAIKAGFKIQLYNIQELEKIKAIEVSELILYWKFENNGTRIILVSKKNVYYWDWESSDLPVKYFKLFDDLLNYRIMTCKVDSSGKYHLICGLNRIQGKVKGLIQLYSEKTQESQCINAYSADFFDWKEPNSDKIHTLLCFVNKVDDFISIHSVELIEFMRPKLLKKFIRSKDPVFGCKYFEHPLPPSRVSDFPIALFPSSTLPFLHVVS